MEENIIYDNNVSEELMRKVIKRQLEKNDKISFQFNNFLYTELKQDTLDMVRKVREFQDYDNDRTR